MASKLEADLMAAGYTPEPLHCDDVAIWTGWRAPEDDRLGAETTPSTYERYYDLITDAMYAQMDDSPWDREHHPCRGSVGGRCPVLSSWVTEYRAVLDCWHSMSEAPPAPEGR